MVVKGESKGLFLRSSNLGYARQKAKKKKKSTQGVKREGKWKKKLCYTVACVEWEWESTAVFAQRLVL